MIDPIIIRKVITRPPKGEERKSTRRLQKLSIMEIRRYVGKNMYDIFAG